MKSALKFATLFVLVSLTIGCEKDEHDDHPPAGEVVIAIQLPTTTTEVPFGENYQVKATITSPDVLHGWLVKIENLTSEEAATLEIETISHQSNFTINEVWTNTEQVTSNMKLTVRAYKNMEQTDFAQKTVQFKCLGPG
jgi:hypothetical protein